MINKLYKLLYSQIIMDEKKYRGVFEQLLEDYLLVKKKAIRVGYDDKSFNFKDYLDTFNKLQSKLVK